LAAITHKVAELRQSGVLGQLVRFAIAGGISTVIYAAVYMPLVTWVFPHMAVAAVPFAFAVAVTCGFFLHSAWSFKGHGTRDSSGRQHVKFVTVQGAGLVLNALFTWVLADLMKLPDWVPLIPVVLVTPLVTFSLNRQWVFG
jgi:putative flippase GtrA